MNLKHIFESTDFVHASGTKEELQVAEFLKSQCEELGVPAHLEGFRVAMGDIEEVHLLADGQEIPCKALSCCGSGAVEGGLYYMPGMDPVSLAGAKDKIVLLDQGVGFFSYHDLMKAGAKGLIFQYGNVHYPNTDIDQRDLREAAVGEERKVLCAMIHSGQAMELVKNKVKNIRLEIFQHEYDGESHNVIAEIPGKREEYIVLSAHYDTTSLSHGAYDNMSGCAGLLGIMEQLKDKELGEYLLLPINMFRIGETVFLDDLTAEDVESIVDLEKPDGAVVQFGGQTAIKLTEALMKMGVPILGTSAENVDAAEDRELFDEILEECCIPRPKGTTVFTCEEAIKVAHELGYPVLVRPSYVLGGQGMQIAINDDDIREFMSIINRHVQEHPILVDKYLMGKEVEVDAVCDGENILIPGIMEHIERAGIHSGDSISVYPAKTISEKAKETIAEYTRRLARALHVIGMINIQFIVLGDDVYVIEVNPRSSRTVPYISKVTGIPIVPLATKVILGYKLKDMGYEPGLQPEAKHYAIKMPVFSFEKIRGADISLGPEMKSTGECLGIAETFNEALYKAFIGAGIRLPKHKNMIITVKDEDKQDIIPIARRFEALGYRIYATLGTAKVLKENGIKVIRTNKLEQPAPNLMDLILGHKIDVVIDTPPQGVEHQKDGFVIRRNAIETGVNVLTSLDTAEALATSLENTDLNNLSLIDIATIARR